jgi:hypothetical protein
MTRYCARAVLLLFLLLNLTACTSLRSIGPVSPRQFIELDQPDHVRVTMPGGVQEQLANPLVVGDELVGKRWSSWAFIRQFRLTDDLSIPLADIITLEVGRPDIGRTVLLGLGLVAGFVFAFTLNWK